MYDTVLVANRGEIAGRIISTLHDHKIKAVIVASEPDLKSINTQRADDVIELPGRTALETYLNMDLVIEKAGEKGVEAIHPGYGFLAENHEFASRVIAAGIDFIGPTPDQMHSFGDKIEARKLAVESETPLIPGSNEILDDDELISLADEIGYPVLIKAAAGGGGRGIRLVNERSEINEQIAIARSEAKLSFNDERLFIEQFIPHGRHIEVQVLGTGDEVLHFGERDCTMQRKNQKIIEESPAKTISRELAGQIHETAVRLVSAINYRNAGTVEFLLDSATDDFYFLEVNARIQVEHPVTEMVTGEDLIWRQIQVSAGESLGISQNEITMRGHAIEARIYAEDPYHGFNPSPGKIRRIRHPTGTGVRVESAVEDGSEITTFYDPMISKLITYSHNREGAINKLRNALEGYLISGVHTTIPYILDLIRTDDFHSGEYHTRYLETFDAKIPVSIEQFARAIAVSINQNGMRVSNTQTSRWRMSGWPRWNDD